MNDMYVLEGKRPRLAKTEAEGLAAFNNDRKVARTRVGKVVVRTVFLVIDHNFYGEEPMLFETIVFGGKHDGDCYRASTWEEAEANHKIAVQEVTNSTSWLSRVWWALVNTVRPPDDFKNDYTLVV